MTSNKKQQTHFFQAKQKGRKAITGTMKLTKRNIAHFNILANIRRHAPLIYYPYGERKK